MRREHIVDGWWEMPGEPVPALGWPGTKNGASASGLAAETGAGTARRSWTSATGFVFAGARGRPVDRGSMRAMRDICKKLGVERATPHDLRRTHGTHHHRARVWP